MIRNKIFIFILCLLSFFNLQANETMDEPDYFEDMEGYQENFEYDPLEKFNRIMFTFNKITDLMFVKPLTISYNAFMPRMIKKGINNTFSNLKEPYKAVNYLAQGNPDSATKSMWRFGVNSTVGVLGVFDVAGKLNVKTESTGLAETFAIHGLHGGPYVVLPILNVGTFIDQIDRVAFTLSKPLNLVNDSQTRYTLHAVSFLDAKAKYMPTIDSITKHAVDEYAVVRTSYLQNRRKRMEAYCQTRENLLKKVCQTN